MTRSRSFNRLVASLGMTAVAALAGCSTESRPSDSSVGVKPTVYVVNYPLQYFAERIGGDLVDIHFPVPADEDPAFWRPSADVIAAFQSADLIFLNGATYAKWVETASLPKSKTVDTSASFGHKLIETTSAVTHGHGPSGEHSHAGTAFTTWLDFDQARQQASAVKRALINLMPDHTGELTTNFAALQKDLLALNTSMQGVAEQIGDQPLVASHPVYQYLGRRYALNIKAVHWEPDVVPDDEDIADLKKLLLEHPARWMIWEGPPDPRTLELLASMEISSIVFDPCGNRPPESAADWLGAMRQNIANLDAAF